MAAAWASINHDFLDNNLDCLRWFVVFLLFCIDRIWSFSPSRLPDLPWNCRISGHPFFTIEQTSPFCRVCAGDRCFGHSALGVLREMGLLGMDGTALSGTLNDDARYESKVFRCAGGVCRIFSRVFFVSRTVSWPSSRSHPFIDVRLSS